MVDDGVAPPERPGVSGRVGIRVAVQQPWRWWVPGDPNVSPGRVGSGRAAGGKMVAGPRRRRAAVTGHFDTPVGHRYDDGPPAWVTNRGDPAPPPPGVCPFRSLKTEQ